MRDDLKKIILSQKDIIAEISIKYDVEEYVSKLYEFATILTYYSGSLLKGFIAYYSNDVLKESAYLTIIIIDKDSRGEGLGKLLLEGSISDLINRGFKSYRLEVLKKNEKALVLYKKYGFEIKQDLGDSYIMILNLKENAK